MRLNKENYDKLKSEKLKRAQIAEIFGIPDWKLKKHVAANGWGKIVPKYLYNGCFSTLDEYSAYWAGFLFADGCVDSKNRVRLMLQELDEAHIVKFQNFVEANDYAIQQCSGYTRRALEFTSSDMCHDLAKFGIVPNKTLISSPPAPDRLGEYLPDFLRGLFDGDGTICESFSNKNSVTATLYTGFAIAKQNMEWLDDVLTRVVGVTYKSFEKQKIFTITLNTNKSIELLSYMYQYSSEDIRLNRKFDMFNHIVLGGNRKVR